MHYNECYLLIFYHKFCLYIYIYEYKTKVYSNFYCDASRSSTAFKVKLQLFNVNVVIFEFQKFNWPIREQQEEPMLLCLYEIKIEEKIEEKNNKKNQCCSVYEIKIEEKIEER